jgi:hypothetical protein
LVQRRMLEMATLNLSLHSSIWCSKACSVGRLRRMPLPSSAFPGDLQHIHHPRNHPGCSTSAPFSIVIIGEGKVVVLHQQGSCVHLGEVLQCIFTKFFSLVKTSALWNKISSFQQLMDKTIAEVWERLQDYISACPHHGMEEWFIIQSFYYELIHSAREHIDAAVGGSFFALSIEAA